MNVKLIGHRIQVNPTKNKMILLLQNENRAIRNEKSKRQRIFANFLSKWDVTTVRQFFHIDCLQLRSMVFTRFLLPVNTFTA